MGIIKYTKRKGYKDEHERNNVGSHHSTICWDFSFSSFIVLLLLNAGTGTGTAGDKNGRLNINTIERMKGNAE